MLRREGSRSQKQTHTHARAADPVASKATDRGMHLESLLESSRISNLVTRGRVSSTLTARCHLGEAASQTARFRHSYGGECCMSWPLTGWLSSLDFSLRSAASSFFLGSVPIFHFLFPFGLGGDQVGEIPLPLHHLHRTPFLSRTGGRYGRALVFFGNTKTDTAGSRFAPYG
ncbi:hypothetical protein BGZ63DRAFT_372246 [Mariannaea sp. PMI_226]|nr:hypothetical protein BGZ63DRAFT_372246 [Mariannaea sp. PMI_226]